MQVSGPVKEDTVPCKKSPRWSAGRRACSIARARGRLTRCPDVTSAFPALRPLMPEGKEIQGASPAPALKGPMTHAYFTNRHHRAAPEARDPVISMREAMSSPKRSDAVLRTAMSGDDNGVFCRCTVRTALQRRRALAPGQDRSLLQIEIALQPPPR